MICRWTFKILSYHKSHGSDTSEFNYHTSSFISIISGLINFEVIPDIAVMIFRGNGQDVRNIKSFITQSPR